MANTGNLQAVKTRYGGLVKLDFIGYDLPAAHHLLGGHVREQVHKILRQRLDRLDARTLAMQFDQARSCGSTLASKKADSHLDSRLRTAVSDYLECLAAWAEGAGLADFDHPALATYRPFETIDLALFLQHDSSGCQTGLYRTDDGSIILWHTEEDIEFAPGSGFDQLRLAAFTLSDGSHPVTMQAFIYPDLLPGPAFGWRSDGYAQAVDTLHIKTLPEVKSGVLANVATWLSLRLGAVLEPGDVIKAMQPYVDGYALNAVYQQAGKVRAVKYEFTASRILPSQLDDSPGRYLFQTNIFSQRSNPWVAELEDELPYSRDLYEQRLLRTQAAIQNKDGRVGVAGDMRFFFNLLTSQAGGGWAYANPDVKAYLLMHLSAAEMEVWLGHGPALPGDRYSIERFQSI